MKLRFVIFLSILFFIESCGSKKKISEKKTTSEVVLNEEKPKKLLSVNEKDFVKRLKRENPNLNDAKLAYIKKYAAIAVEEMNAYRIPASITLAQGILESGSGKSQLAAKSNNHFGIKCHVGWQGDRVYHDDDEKGECFRKYKFVETSYKDHSEFLTTRNRYSFLFNYGVTDYINWAKGLKKAGYATDKQYPNKLISIIEDYRLYKFDSTNNTEVSIKKEMPKEIKPKYTIAAYYMVKKGDTLYSISRKFNTTVAVIKELNGLKDNIISIGQHLLTK